jgi:hypothetical protein
MPAASSETLRAFSASFQKSGDPIASSKVWIFISRAGTSKIPPELRKAAFQAVQIERQEVSGRK